MFRSNEQLGAVEDRAIGRARLGRVVPGIARFHRGEPDARMTTATHTRNVPGARHRDRHVIAATCVRVELLTGTPRRRQPGGQLPGERGVHQPTVEHEHVEGLAAPFVEAARPGWRGEYVGAALAAGRSEPRLHVVGEHRVFDATRDRAEQQIDACRAWGGQWAGAAERAAQLGGELTPGERARRGGRSLAEPLGGTQQLAAAAVWAPVAEHRGVEVEVMAAVRPAVR